MLDDMKLRDFADKTQEAYLHAVASLAKHYRRAPDLLCPEEIRAFFLFLVNDRKLSASSVRQHLCGIRFFYETTLGRRYDLFDLVNPKRGRKLPTVLSRDEVRAVLHTVRKHSSRVLLTTMITGPGKTPGRAGSAR